MTMEDVSGCASASLYILSILNLHIMAQVGICSMENDVEFEGEIHAETSGALHVRNEGNNTVVGNARPKRRKKR
jgi:hypothetical protein